MIIWFIYLHYQAITQSASNMHPKIHTLFDHIYSLFLLSKCPTLALIPLSEMLTHLLKTYLRYGRNLALKIWVFGRHLRKISKILRKKTSNQLALTTYVNFEIICKNLVYEYKNKKDTTLLKYYTKRCLKKRLQTELKKS